MQKPAIAASVIGIVGLGVAGLISTGIVPNPVDASKGAVSACSDKISEQLRSPSSMKVFWSEFTPRAPLTWDEAHPHKDFCPPPLDGHDDVIDAIMCRLDKQEQKVREKLRKGLPPVGREEEDVAESIHVVERNRADFEARAAENLPEVQSGFVTLEYDADNSFGTPIRAFAICRFGAIGSDVRFQKSEIVLSGPIDPIVGRQAKESSGHGN